MRETSWSEDISREKIQTAFLEVLGHVCRNIERKRGFAHAWPRADQHKVAVAEPHKRAVQSGKAGRRSFERAFVLGDEFQILIDARKDIADFFKIFGLAPFGDLKDPLLGRVEHMLDLSDLGIGFAGDFLAGLNQTAQRAFVFDDLGVIDDVCGCGNRFCNEADILRAARLVIDAVPSKRVDQRDGSISRFCLYSSFMVSKMLWCSSR